MKHWLLKKLLYSMPVQDIDELIKAWIRSFNFKDFQEVLKDRDFYVSHKPKGRFVE